MARTLTPFATLSRPNTLNYYDASGAQQTAAADEQAPDYLPTGERRGLKMDANSVLTIDTSAINSPTGYIIYSEEPGATSDRQILRVDDGSDDNAIIVSVSDGNYMASVTVGGADPQIVSSGIPAELLYRKEIFVRIRPRSVAINVSGGEWQSVDAQFPDITRWQSGGGACWIYRQRFNSMIDEALSPAARYGTDKMIKIFKENKYFGAYYDPSDYNTLFQDSAGTVPVTGSGQPVALMMDKSGNNNHATAPSDSSRPMTGYGNDVNGLIFDGVDDQLITPKINIRSYFATAKLKSDGIVYGLPDISDRSEIFLKTGSNFYIDFSAPGGYDVLSPLTWDETAAHVYSLRLDPVKRFSVDKSDVNYQDKSGGGKVVSSRVLISGRGLGDQFLDGVYFGGVLLESEISDTDYNTIREEFIKRAGVVDE